MQCQKLHTTALNLLCPPIPPHNARSIAPPPFTSFIPYAHHNSRSCMPLLFACCRPPCLPQCQKLCISPLCLLCRTIPPTMPETTQHCPLPAAPHSPAMPEAMHHHCSPSASPHLPYSMTEAAHHCCLPAVPPHNARSHVPLPFTYHTSPQPLQLPIVNRTLPPQHYCFCLSPNWLGSNGVWANGQG